MTLSVQLKRRLGAFDIDASFQSSGGLTALFGPSGSGKTSVINMIGGLISPASGRVAVSGQVLVDTAAGIAIPRHKRRIGYVFQDARLFPHLTVGQKSSIWPLVYIAGPPLRQSGGDRRPAGRRPFARPQAGGALRRREAAHRHRTGAGGKPQAHSDGRAAGFA